MRTCILEGQNMLSAQQNSLTILSPPAAILNIHIRQLARKYFSFPHSKSQCKMFPSLPTAPSQRVLFLLGTVHPFLVQICCLSLSPVPSLSTWLHLCLRKDE